MNKIIKLLLLPTFLFVCVLNIFAQIDPTGGNQPLSLTDIKNAFANQKKTPQKFPNCNTPILMSKCLITAINRRGISFVLSPQDQTELKNLGATDELIKTINKLNADDSLKEVEFELKSYDRTCEESCLTRAFATNEAALERLAVSNPGSVGNIFFNRGRILYRQKKYKEAIEELLKAINNKFGGAEIHEFLARNYHFDKNYEKAIEYYNLSIKLDNNFFGAYNNRGITFEDKKEYDAAIKDFNKSIELNPKLTVAYNNRGITFDKMKEYDTAIKEYTKAIELNPNYAEAYYNRGVAFGNMKEYDAAIKDFNKSIELNPKLSVAYKNRGIAFGNKKEYDAAIKDFTKAVELNLNYAEAYYNRGVAFHNQKEYDSAIKDYDKAIELNPNYAVAYCNRSLAHKKLGKFAEAEADMEKYEELTKKQKP